MIANSAGGTGLFKDQAACPFRAFAHVRLASEALEAPRPGLDPRERAVAAIGVAPEAIIRVANAEMVRAIRVMTVERGVDPREMALVAFGGAGGLHAAGIAEELGMKRVLCPRASGVLAALGLVVSERRRDVQRSVLSTDLAVGPRIAQELAEQALLPDAQIRIAYDMRYRGQAFELTVAEPRAEAFAAAHEQAYGFRDDDADIELVTVRVTAAQQPSTTLEAPVPPRAVEGPQQPSTTLGVPVPPRVDEGSRETIYGATRVLSGDPPPGLTASGPTVFALREATLVVPPGWAAEVLESSTIRMTR